MLVYKSAFIHEKTVKIITAGRASQFDPDILDAFIEIESEL
jgi:putative two-component system response regulator